MRNFSTIIINKQERIKLFTGKFAWYSYFFNIPKSSQPINLLGFFEDAPFFHLPFLFYGISIFINTIIVIPFLGEIAPATLLVITLLRKIDFLAGKNTEKETLAMHSNLTRFKSAAMSCIILCYICILFLIMYTHTCIYIYIYPSLQSPSERSKKGWASFCSRESATGSRSIFDQKSSFTVTIATSFTVLKLKDCSKSHLFITL